MSITRETVQSKTPFIFITDKCESGGCGNPLGFDGFQIDLPVVADSELPEKYEDKEEEFTKLVAEKMDAFMVLYSKNPDTMTDEERAENFKAIAELADELYSEYGTKVLPCFYALEVEYNEAPKEGAFVRLSYVEINGDEKHTAMLFQGNVESAEKLVSVFEMVTKDADTDSFEYFIEDLILPSELEQALSEDEVQVEITKGYVEAATEVTEGGQTIGKN